MGVTELVLVRHGESTGNVAREQAELSGAEVIAVGCRDADVPLSELGQAQARAVGRWLAERSTQAPLHSAWCSPYKRAHDTARIALDTASDLSGEDGNAGHAHGSIGLRVDERLRDKELGILDTLTTAGILARFPAEAQRREWLGKFYYRAPGGESWADLALRIRSALMDLEQVEDGRRVVVFTHDAMVLLFRYVCRGMDEQALLELGRSTTIGNASITRLVRAQDGQWTVAAFNEQEHLMVDGLDLRTEHGAGQPAPSEATSTPGPALAPAAR